MLVPLALSGAAFAMIEGLAAALHARGLEAPIYLLSPVAGACLTLANVLPEWVEPRRQARRAAPPAPLIPLPRLRRPIRRRPLRAGQSAPGRRRG